MKLKYVCRSKIDRSIFSEWSKSRRRVSKMFFETFRKYRKISKFPSRRNPSSLLLFNQSMLKYARGKKERKKFLFPFLILLRAHFELSERTEISLIDCVMPPIFFQGSTRSRNLDPSLEFIGNEFIGMQGRGWLLLVGSLEYSLRTEREINFEGGVGFFRRKDDFSLKIDIAVGNLFRG